jgi:hypothetical protein
MYICRKNGSLALITRPHVALQEQQVPCINLVSMLFVHSFHNGHPLSFLKDPVAPHKPASRMMQEKNVFPSLKTHSDESMRDEALYPSPQTQRV